MTRFDFTIMGEPASKSNSRRLVRMKNGRTAVIKSQKALDYQKAFIEQCTVLDNLLDGDLSTTITIYYATRRPDLDESLILDIMQGRIYENDRQIKEKHVFHRLDKEHPRAEISVSKITEKSKS